MKILVCIKSVPDYQAKIKVKVDGSGIDTDGVKWIVNPFDEIAVEEALKLKESGVASEVVVLGIGTAETQTQIRYALAMGAERGIHIAIDSPVDSDLASRLIAEVFKRDTFGLVIMGKQAIDSDAGQTSQLLAQRLALPQACFASKVSIQGNEALVTREVDGGLENVSVELPAVVSTDLRLNTPRYASLPGIMKAKKKPLEEIPAASLGIPLEPLVRTKKMAAPAARSAGRKVSSVTELVAALQGEAKVI